jgi:hypothetical protein
LKEKMMHIRAIILKLLKSLELDASIKPESQNILRVLMELFEYSEAERESMFVRRRRMFGFI